MIQTVTRSFGALMVAAALTLGLAALAPADLEAAPCFCPPGNSQTAHGWTMGYSTCAAAKSACQAQAQGIAVPELYGVVENQHDVRRFREIVAGRDDFVIGPPAHSPGPAPRVARSAGPRPGNG